MSKIFGGSILLDEYTLDLHSAEEWICMFEHTVSSVEDRVIQSLSRGLLSAAKGEFASSEAFFTSALQTAQSIGDARLTSRCETYKILLFAAKADLPMLRFYDDTGGDWRRLNEAQAEAHDRRKPFAEETAAAWPSLDELDKLERSVVKKFAQHTRNLRLGAFPHHPAYHSHQLSMLFDSATPFPAPMADEAERLGLAATSRHLRRLNAAYLLAGASEQGARELEQLYQECLHDSDWVGAASCQLILGDNRLSLPFTSPVVLNLSLMSRTSNSLAHWHDSVEIRHRQMKSITADPCYQQALELFAEAGSIRGTAAVYLRKGCVALVEYLNSRYLGGKNQPTPEPGLDALRASAEAHLDYAFELYQGETGMVNFISGHKIILRVLVSCPPGMVQFPTEEAYGASADAAMIGVWAKDNANMGVAQVVGLLFLGVGRLLSTAPQNLHAASLCCRCARSCFRGAGACILELHAAIQHAKLHQSHGDMDAARSHLDAGQQILADAVNEQINPLIQRATSDENRQALRTIRINQISNFDSAASSIYANNPRADAWTARRRSLLPEQDGSTAIALLSAFMGMITNIRNTPVDASRLGTGATTSFNVVGLAGALSAQPAVSVADERIDMASLLGPLVGDFDTVRKIREQYDMAIDNRRQALVARNDWERGQECLQGVLQSLDQPGVPKSIELFSIRAAVLHHMGRHDVIRQWLPDAIPTLFGGRLPTGDYPSGASPDVKASIRQTVCNHALRSLSMCFIAQDWELGAQVLSKIRKCDPNALDELCTDKSESSWSSMVYIAAIEEHNGNLESSFRWLIRALDIVETSRSKLTDVGDRRELLNVIQSAELFAGLGRVSLRCYTEPQNSETSRRLAETSRRLADHYVFRGPTWADEALLFMEQGRARALLDLLAGEGVSDDFLEWSYRLRKEELEMRSPATAHAGGDDSLAAYLATLRSDLRKEAESPSRAMILARLHQPHFNAEVGSLYESIPDDAVVIHINLSRDGVLLLYITHNGVEQTRISNLTDQHLERRVLKYLKLFKNVRHMEALPPAASCQALLEELSCEIIRPAQKLIDAKSHLIFVPSQSLNNFPFSALLLSGEPLFLQKDVSMVPSLSVLRQLAQAARNNNSSEDAAERLRAAVIYSPPLKMTLAKADSSPPLPLNVSAGAAIEIACRLGCVPQPAHKVSTQTFQEEYKTSDVIFLSTHGLTGNKSAWESNIELRDPFQVLNLVPLRSHAALAVFEACVSGVGESSIGNDVLGFAHSVLSSGVGAFVGALWNVSDKASAMLMSFFFRELTAAVATPTTPTSDGGEGAKALAGSSSLANCLRRAQIRLYHADTHTAKAILDDLRDACRASDPAHINPVHLKKILNTLDAVMMDEEDWHKSLDYSHPFFWAPFVLVGYGGRRLGSLAFSR